MNPIFLFLSLGTLFLPLVRSDNSNILFYNQKLNTLSYFLDETENSYLTQFNDDITEYNKTYSNTYEYWYRYYIIKLD